MSYQKFQRCPGCREWLSVDDILRNPYVRPISLRVADQDPGSRGILFVHDIQSCRASFLMPFSKLSPLLPNSSNGNGSGPDPDCNSQCEVDFDGEVCSRDCTYAHYHRFLLDIINQREQRPSVITRTRRTTEGQAS